MTGLAPNPTTIAAGRYRLGSLIDRDGDVRTYRAHDETLLRPVALTVFPDDAATAGGGTARSHRWRAARLLAGLTHPSLMPVHDAGSEHRRAFVVTPLLDGPGLAERLGGGPLPLDDILATGTALAGALACVHRAGLTHRGLTPRSVLCDADGRPYLRDFALAAATDSSAVTADVIDPTGGAYLAPEQVTGDDVGPAVDIYALGLILLECATGHPEYPSPSGQLASAARARLHRAPEIPGTLPPALRRLLTGMTAHHPPSRPDAEHAAEELRRLGHTAACERPAAPWHRRDAGDEEPHPAEERGDGATAPRDVLADVEASTGEIEVPSPSDAPSPAPATCTAGTEPGAPPAPPSRRRPLGAWSVVLLTLAALVLGLLGGLLGGGTAPAAVPPVAAAAPAGPTTLYGRVAAVTDPGTVVVEVAGREVTVSVLGIDTDAIPPCARPGALAFAHRTLDGQDVTVVPDPTLAAVPGPRAAYLVLASQLSYTDAAIRAGWATPGDTPALYRSVFDDEAREAARAGLGRSGPACR